MSLGRVVESAPADTIFSRPTHPYTQALLRSEPLLEVGKRVFIPVKGEIPSPLNPPTGCHFHPRCPQAMAQCATEKPALRVLTPGHLSACHLNA
jgi:peptide/nickel transport system ATP-binding protein